ncbi:T9SS type A sorting domain-containing protein [Flavobacterium psychrophilum]|nr:T9SS type A sorting domain-containing protein [Flavobacterium psychrophilum]
MGGITDTGGAVYSGSCGSLALISCNDSSSLAGNDHPLITVTARTPGEVLYYRVWEYGNNSFGQFKVSTYDASLSAQSFDMAGFSAYPNPVNEVLNLSYTKEISNVSVHNLLGQQVMAKAVNASQSKIDMSNLSNGTYLVKVTVDGLVKTLKVVKQ